MSAIFTEKELARYSFTKALNQIIESQAGMPLGFPGKLSGLEAEVDDALRNRFYNNPAGPSGFLLPLSALKALNVTTATQGGFLAESSFPASIIPALRNKAVVAA